MTRKGGRRILGIDSGTRNEGESVQELDEEVVFLGWYRSHFGNFLLESMARTWILSDVPPDVRVTFLNGLSSDHGPISIQMLEALGIPESRVLTIDRPTRIRRLLIPEPLYEVGYAAHTGASHPHRRIAERILGDGSAGRSDQPVYLSRRMLHGGARHIAGESQLEDLLRENGILVVYPDGMTLSDQVRLFNRHTDIICPQGSAAHGILFALARPRLHLLTPSTVISDYFLTPTLAQSQTAFINCLATAVDGGPNFPLALEARKLVGYLSGHGLLKVPWTGEMLDSPATIRKEFDELVTLAHVLEAFQRSQPLPQELLTQATVQAADFWPITLALADYHSRESGTAPEALAQQFVTQVIAEQDLGMLIRYRPQVTESVRRVATCCSPGLEQALLMAVRDRFGLAS